MTDFADVCYFQNNFIYSVVYLEIILLWRASINSPMQVVPVYPFSLTERVGVAEDKGRFQFL